MKPVRRLSIAALVVACLHLVFGAIVRISGSGMGCGDHWPKCYGYWFPPFSRPDLMVEVSHRYLASILVLTVSTLAFVAFRRRAEPGVSGRGGVLRSALGAVAAVFAAAILGGVTVKMGNAPWATVAHWLVAMTLLAMVATTAIRAGALGGTSARKQRGTSRAARSAFAAAGLAIFAVALGGLTAKVPGASVSCTTVPSCGRNPGVDTAAVMVQMTHRTAAVVLVLHLFGMVMMLRKRHAEEATVVVRAAQLALGMVVLQLIVASSMILFHLPGVLRSLHEATGVGIWLSCFALAYLARRTAANGGSEAVLPVPAPALMGAPEPRVSARVRPAAQPVAELRMAEVSPVVVERAPASVRGERSVGVEAIAVAAVAHEPIADEATTGGSIAVEPIADEPIIVAPVALEAIALEPIALEPMLVEPIVAEPIVERPGRRIVIEQANAIVEYSIVEELDEEEPQPVAASRVEDIALAVPERVSVVEDVPQQVVVVEERVAVEGFVAEDVAFVEDAAVTDAANEGAVGANVIVESGAPVEADSLAPTLAEAVPVAPQPVAALPVEAPPVETPPVAAPPVVAPPAATLASRKATMAVIVARGADL